MRRVIYLSHSVDAMTQDRLAAIAAKSSRKNSTLGLTGALVLREGLILQILEGPEASMQERLSAIQRDPRHHRFVVLSDGPVTHRSYPDQPMALLHLDELPQDARDALEAMFELEPKPTPRRLRDILPRFSPLLAA